MVKESIPKEGEYKNPNYKHDGNIHRVWSETTILKRNRSRHHWWNDHLVTESDGRTWITRVQSCTSF